MPFLSNYFSEHKVDTIAIGEPTQRDGTPSAIEGNIQNFIKGFKEKFPNIVIVRVDERFTSKMASQTMIDSGLKKKQRQNKALVDQISATIILQQFLYTK
jgi:putative Holliday junction resolvase